MLRQMVCALSASFVEAKQLPAAQTSCFPILTRAVDSTTTTDILGDSRKLFLFHRSELNQKHPRGVHIVPKFFG